VPTNTHVILLRDFSTPWTEPCIVVQAFTVPDDQRPVENGKGHLHLSHEGIFSIDGDDFPVIRNSVVDPTTGAISVKLLEQHSDSFDFPATYISLTLEKPSPANVSPITIDRHHVLIKGDVATQTDTVIHNYCDIDMSDDGYARGWFTLDSLDLDVVKFTIDATQDRCVAVLSQFPGAEWNAAMDSILHSSPEEAGVVLDSVIGRMSLVDNRDSDDQAVVVVDIE
jgi:hypothetical protein